MKLSQEVKNYLNKEILKETASGYTYRMIDGRRCRISYSDTPNDYIIVSNSSGSYGGYVDWKLWVKDPNNKYFDIYCVNARAKLDADWNINLNYYNPKRNPDTESFFIGTRHYSNKTSICIYYNVQLDRLEAVPSSAHWRNAKQPIEIYDNDPSLREPDKLSLRDLSSYQTTINDIHPTIWASKLCDNWSRKEFSPEIRQIITDVYDLTNFFKAYPNGVRVPQDLLNLLRMSDKELTKRANTRKNNEDSITEYKEATKGFETEDTAFRIGDKIYFNRCGYRLYVKNLKSNTLVCYTDFDRTAAKSAVPKNGATSLGNGDIFDNILRRDLFEGCFDENGKHISFAECFGKQSNVTTFFDYYDVPEYADAILNLFTIRGKYAKFLELAIKSQNKFLIQKIIDRKCLEKEQYDKKSYWEKRDFLCFDGAKTNIPQMLNVNKYIVNQIKNLSVNQDVGVISAYIKLSALFNNLSMTDFLDIYINKCHYSLNYDGHEALFTLFAKDGLQTFKKRIAAYGSVVMRYDDYLRTIEQLKALSAIDPTVVFNPSEWPLFPEAAIKHVTLFQERTYYGYVADIKSTIRVYTDYTLSNVKFTVLSKTEEQAVLELNMDPAHHLLFLESELTKIFNLYKDKARNEAFKHSIERLKAYEFSDGQLSVVAPTQASDLTTEGSVLHHCVGSFIDAVASNRENVVFIRRNDLLNEPYYTMAISPSGGIEQVHCAYNGDLTKEGQERAFETTQRDVYHKRFDLIKFLKQWASAMKKKGIAIDPTSIKERYLALGAHR